jgi:hypothetical protein
VLAEKESPLKNGVQGKECEVHGFNEELNKHYARKGSGFDLDGVICRGKFGGVVCGAEFVVDVCEAINPEKAIVPGKGRGAWWCPQCKMCLCTPCHQLYCDSLKKRGRRLKMPG